MSNTNEFFLPDLEELGIDLPKSDVEEKEEPIQEEVPETEEEDVVEDNSDKSIFDDLEEETEEDESNISIPSDSDTTTDVHTPLYRYLKDQEFFPEGLIKEGQEPKTAEDFFNLVEERNKLYEGEVVKQLHNYYVEKFPEEIRPLIDVIQSGEQVDKNKIIELMSSVYQIDYTDEQLSDPSIATDYLIKSYAKMGTFNQAAIENMVDALSDEEKVEAFKKSYESERTNKQEQIRKLQEDSEKAKANRRKLGETFNQNLEKLPWKPSYKNEIKQFVGGGEFKTKLETLARDPSNLHLLAEFVKFYDPEKGFKLDDYLKLKGKTGGIQEAKKKINSYFDGVPRISKENAKDQKAINVDKIINSLDI